MFCSTWISNTGSHRPACAELALVHDCLPERVLHDQPELIALRRRWWHKATAHLAVSSATAGDLVHFLQKPNLQVPWCHLAPAHAFNQALDSCDLELRWNRLQREAGLPDSFVLLPATSAIGSYKNPELVAGALADRDLLTLPILICGIAADQRAHELEVAFPHLRGRLGCRLQRSELALAYHKALAVVIPAELKVLVCRQSRSWPLAVVFVLIPEV